MLLKEEEAPKKKKKLKINYGLTSINHKYELVISRIKNYL